MEEVGAETMEESRSKRERIRVIVFYSIKSCLLIKNRQITDKYSFKRCERFQECSREEPNVLTGVGETLGLN